MPEAITQKCGKIDTPPTVVKNTTPEPKREPKLSNKTLEAFKLVEAGLEPAEALKAVNYTAKISQTSVSQFKAKLRKHTLTNPAIVKSAHGQIKRILKGETREVNQQTVTKDGQVIDYIETIAPTDSNILAAASMVYDRFEPVKQALPSDQDKNTYIDLRQYNFVKVEEKENQVTDV